MADYLEKYIERVADVPVQLHRKFRMIRDLDERSVHLQAEIDAKCRQQLESMQPKGAKPGQQPSKRAKISTEETPLSAEIAAGMKQIISWSEEKMHIAAQVYDMIDKHIRELDEDLKAFASDIEEEQQSAGLLNGETACDRLGIDSGMPQAVVPAAQQAAAAAAVAQAAAAAAAGEEKRQKRKYTRRKGTAAEAAVAAYDGAGTSAAAEQAAAAAAAAEQNITHVEGDASEPRYCICKGVSYGEMVACDNEECPIEWFHYGCVGITEQPKGKWYCPQCTADMALKAGA